MSGGHFNYDQHRLNDIADSIDTIIENNSIEDDWGYCTNYSEQTLSRLAVVSKMLRTCYDLVHEVDWMLSGDTGEDTFNREYERIQDGQAT